MFAFLNGRFVLEAQASVSIADRGFLYGDGLFEALRVVRGLPFQWEDHMARLARGAEILKIVPPLTAGEMQLAAGRLVSLNATPDAMLRITLTRGPGPRGYSPKGAVSPTLAMTLHPAPKLNAKRPRRLRLITSSIHVPADDPLANMKTCNKLPHILARSEADAAGVDDALMLNTRGHFAEATSRNLFWIEGSTVCTPPLNTGALAGITRATVLGLCASLGIPTRQVMAGSKALRAASGVFLTSSGIGVAEVISLDGMRLRVSPVVTGLRKAYGQLMNSTSP